MDQSYIDHNVNKFQRQYRIININKIAMINIIKKIE